MAINRIDGDLNVVGHLTCSTLNVPAGTIDNADVNGSAGIAATKIQKPRLLRYSASGTAATATVPIYECRGATATVQSLRCGSIAAAIGDSTVTVDLKKNGSTILSGVVTLDNANTARVSEAAAFASTSLVVGDWLELVITATIGTGTLPTGLFVQCEIFEDQP